MDLSNYKEEKPHHFKRVIWFIVNATIFRCLPGMQLRYFRNLLLRMFGAKVPIRTLIYSSCKIWAPWNLVVGKYACIGPNTELYNKDMIVVGDNTVISQGSILCTASHDITDSRHPLITAPIVLGDRVWVASNAFIGMGVTIGEGAVVGATASVYKDVEPWTVVGGNPAKFIKKRVIKN